MKKLLIISILTLSLAANAANDEGKDYSKGIIWVNEDWYGPQNSTLNQLLPDDPDANWWNYRVFQTENPGYELGCTNQYGAYWNGRIYLIAKQEKDPGATITGGRITIADGRSLKLIKQLQTIDPTGVQCDGRGFVGVDANKGYVSTSNGVWILDLNSLEITGKVQGTDNPNAGGDNDRPNDDPTGSLYYGQSGMMVRAAGKIFVAHQQYGLLVVDPEQDRVTSYISMDIVTEGAGIGSVVRSKDGMLWLSVATNTNGTGSVIDKLVRVDPTTLATDVVDLPDDICGPANSWYAWTPDAFVASSATNHLYWKGGKNQWFSGQYIYKFDCDSRQASLLIDLGADGENWNIYGCSLGVDPVTDDLYMALFHQFGDPTYVTRRYTSAGVKVRDYEMIRNYWFPSLPLFPESHLSGIENVDVAPQQIISVADGAITIVSDNEVMLEIYNISGRCVLRLQTATATMPLNLESGIYIAKAGTSILKFAI